MGKMHLICNAHIDPMWQWEWEEGIGAVLSTFRVAVELCEKEDAFIFNHNEAMIAILLQGPIEMIFIQRILLSFGKVLQEVR